MKLRHVRTGKILDVAEKDLHRYPAPRYVPLEAAVPEGTVAEVLAWADTPERKAAALTAELAGKNRKGVLDGLL